jgi:hypothetical protein
MANALFDVDTGLRVGGNYWFASNGNITTTGTIIAGNIQVTGATSVTNINIENTTYQQATNFSTANAWISGGAIGVDVTGTVSPVANVYATLAYIDNFSSPNIQITSGSVTTLVATNFSSGNARVTGGSITGGTGAFTTLVADNFSSANVYQSAAGTLVATNFSSGNIYQSAAGTLVATNFSSGNAAITGTQTYIGGNNSGKVANVYATLGYFGQMSSGNITMTGDITQSATGTFTYAANTLPPKQYVDVMSVVFGS